MTLEVRTEKFPLSPVRDMLWTREQSWLSLLILDKKLLVGTCNSLLLNSRLGFLKETNKSLPQTRETPPSYTATGIISMLYGKITGTKLHETQFLCKVFCLGSSSATANATRTVTANVPRATYSPLKVPLTADTRFGHHSLGIVPTKGTLGSGLAFFIDLPLSHDTRLPLQQPRNKRRKKNRVVEAAGP